MVANIQTARLMLKGGRPEIHEGLHMAIGGIAEESGDVRIGGSPLKRGNTAVGSSVVTEVLIAKDDPGLCPRRYGESRTDAVTLQIDVFPEAVRVLVHPVQ